MSNKRLSLTEIAKTLGVSSCTVSVVLNNRDKEARINSKTAEKIREYCRSIGYQPNIHTRRMQSRIVRNVMFYTSSYSGVAHIDNIIAGILGGVLDRASEEKVTITMRCGHISSADDVIFNSFRSREIDGLILYGTELPEEWKKVFRDEARQVVGINMCGCDCVQTVNINNREISNQLVEDYLISRGRKKFIYLGGTRLSQPGNDRFQGFKDALESAKIEFPAENHYTCNFSMELAVNAVEEHLKRCGTLPDAIVCANDLMAAAVIEYLKAKNIAVPEQVAVVGGDGIDAVQFITPKLTGFSTQPILLGKTAFDLLWAKVNGKKVSDIILPGVMVAGASA